MSVPRPRANPGDCRVDRTSNPGGNSPTPTIQTRSATASPTRLSAVRRVVGDVLFLRRAIRLLQLSHSDGGLVASEKTEQMRTSIDALRRHSGCNTTLLGDDNEKDASDIDGVHVARLWVGRQRASIVRLQSRPSPTAARGAHAAASTGTGVLLDRWLLVSRRQPLSLARRILDTPAVPGRPVDRAAI